MAAGGEEHGSVNLAAALRRDAKGLLGTTVEYGELVSILIFNYYFIF